MSLPRAFSATLVVVAASFVLVPFPRLRAQEPPAQEAEKPRPKRATNSLDEIGRKRVPILEALAEKHGYRLEPGQVLRRLTQPFPDARMEYYRAGHPGQAQAIPDGPSVMIFKQSDGKLSNMSMTFSGGEGHSVEGLVTGLTGIRSQMIEGGDVRQARVQGDWVVREGATNEQIVDALAAILREELKMDVSMEFREIEFPVYIARGTYTFTPIEGGRKRRGIIRDNRVVFSDPIEIFGKGLVPDSGAGGGSGDFDKFLAWLGDWIGEPIVSELKEPPGSEFSWHLHARSPATEQERAEDHAARLVLPNITAQTGLTFTQEQRPLKMLFVEGTK